MTLRMAMARMAMGQTWRSWNVMHILAILTISINHSMTSFILNPLGKYGSIWYIIYFSSPTRSFPEPYQIIVSVWKNKSHFAIVGNLWTCSEILQSVLVVVHLPYFSHLLTFLLQISPPSSKPPLKGGFDPAHVGRSPREPLLIPLDLDARVHLGRTMPPR